MIDDTRLTRNERAVLRDALVVYCASLDRRIVLLAARQASDDLTWRRYLCDELLDQLRP